MRIALALLALVLLGVAAKTVEWHSKWDCLASDPSREPPLFETTPSEGTLRLVVTDTHCVVWGAR